MPSNQRAKNSLGLRGTPTHTQNLLAEKSDDLQKNLTVHIRDVWVMGKPSLIKDLIDKFNLKTIFDFVPLC